MGELLVRSTNDESRPLDSDSEPADLGVLRRVLVGPEQQRLAALQRRLDDPDARASDIAEVLPQVLLRHAQDPQFTRALTPPLERALTAAVRRDPKPMADALFPIMGPAIRKAVAASLAGMVESLNRTLEHSLSWRSIRWRLEARRSGRTFGEVLLLKTLIYRVDQVFLIDRRTGLLLLHVHHASAPVEDADMVSGMLTAITDFARDSFKVSDADSLEAFKVGELSVWIEPGPHAFVASVIRGAAPREYRRTLQEAVETIHLQFGDRLASFTGDAAELAGARSSLEACLEAEYRPEERKPPARGAWILLGAGVLALAVWAGIAYRAHARWTGYVDALRAEPGIVVVNTWREGGRYVVSGLRDPLSRDPAALVAGTGLAVESVEGRWAPYHSLDRALVLARATAALRPPAGVTLVLDNGVLAATGTPPLEWIVDAERTGRVMPGVVGFDAARSLAGTLQAAVAAIESAVILFPRGGAGVSPGQSAPLARLVSDVRELEKLAAAAGSRFRLDIIGHTDADGPPQSNVPLSRARADAVSAAIAPGVSQAIVLNPAGVGSSEPAVRADTADANERNRRVVVRVARLD